MANFSYGGTGTQEQEKAVNKVEDTLQHMDSGKKEQILSSFNEFKRYLGGKIELAESMGLSEEHLAKLAQKVANYLAAHEEPRNTEEKLLQELWKVGTQQEQHKLAHMLVRLAQSSK
ncbi:MAG: yflH [Paenibacillus sp.]|nr:yflH [Paenibacillus sp.]